MNQRKRIFIPYTNTGYWHVFKAKIDICWYAICRCGFVYRCSKNDNSKDGMITSQSLNNLYNYCPICGKKYNTTKYVSYLNTQIPVEIWYDSKVTYMDLIRYCHKKHNKGEIINAT